MDYNVHMLSESLLLRKPAALIFPAVLTDTPKLADVCAPRCGVSLTHATPTLHRATRRPMLQKPMHAPLHSALRPAKSL